MHKLVIYRAVSDALIDELIDASIRPRRRPLCPENGCFSVEKTSRFLLFIILSKRLWTGLIQ